jgi:hypothetical protein
MACGPFSNLTGGTMKRFLNLSLASLLASTSVATLSACEDPTANTIEQARDCSDKAAQLALANPGAASGTSGAGAVCASMLANINTAEANQIKFGDILIEDGILGNIAQAAQNQSVKTGGVDALNSMLLVLIDPVPTDVTTLTNVANGSNSNGMIYVAGLIGMATTLNTLSTLTTATTASSVPATITACAGSAPCAAALQTTYNSMATAACSYAGDATLCSKAQAISAAAGPNPTAAALANAIATYASTAH